MSTETERSPGAQNACQVVSVDRGIAVCERCEIADRPLSRLRGLLGHAGLQPGHGLLLRPSNSIHTAFMRFPIDAVFLDADLRVLKVRSDLQPWRAAACRKARAVLEIPAGEAERRGLTPGERLRLTDSSVTGSPIATEKPADN